MDEYVLTASEVAAIRELEAQIVDLTAQRNGALKMIAKQQGLEGSWDFRGDRLVRVETQQ